MDGLKTLTGYERLTPDERLDLVLELDERLGPDWQAEDLVGEAELPSVNHLPSGMAFVAIPGGSFEMGLSEDDLAEARRYIEGEHVERHVALEGDWAKPVRRVNVSPFLLARDLATPRQMKQLSNGALGRESLGPADVQLLSAHLTSLRIPSEAELEYVMREGGKVRFVADAARRFASGSFRRPFTNGWGIHNLLANAWTADAWHDSYDGAPNDGSPYNAGDEPPGVFRGDLPTGVEYPAALTAALAAYRGRYREDQETEVCVRFARCVPMRT